MSNHPKWGNPRDHQILAETSEGQHNYWVIEDVPEKRIFGILIRKAAKRSKFIRCDSLSTAAGDNIPDDVPAYREFRFRCGLMKGINVLSGSKSRFSLYLDGFENLNVDISQTEFEFDPRIGDIAIAEINFSNERNNFGCTKYGPIRSMHIFVTLIFRDQNQMREFIVATSTAPSPDATTEHWLSESKGYLEGDSSSWPLIAAAGFALLAW